MERHEKFLIARLVLSALLFGLSFLSALNGLGALLMSIAALVIIAYDIVVDLIVGIFKKEFESEKLLMLIASIGAFAIGEYHEGLAVMWLYQLGEFLQDLAVEHSKKSIVKLMDIRPDYANVLRDNSTVKVRPEEANIGETIVVLAGEKIPLDGEIISGKTTLDTAALTGESLPREAGENSKVLAGTVNLSATIHIKVTAKFKDSTVAKIIELVENSENNKAKPEKFITKFAKIYTPIVVGLAVILAVLPPLILGGGWIEWLHRALMLLVISCPCALVLSIPLSFFAGIGGASRNGILIKGANFLETLTKCDTVLFDKTGTLTAGKFAVSKVCPVGISEEELINLAALAESESNHPIALSIKAYAKSQPDTSKLLSTETISGMGIKASTKQGEILVGNYKLMQQENIKCINEDFDLSNIYVAKSGKFVGQILIEDSIKPTSAEAVQMLKTLGIKNIVMLSGDKEQTAKLVAEKLQLNAYYAELLPQDKAEKLNSIKAAGGKVVMVGDGINDAPVLKLADVGMAMGALGSDATIEASDVVIMDDEPTKIADAITISRKTMKLVKQNIVFTIAFKVLMLVLGALGIANMWMAVIADVGVSLLAVLNALRTLKKPNNKKKSSN